LQVRRRQRKRRLSGTPQNACAQHFPLLHAGDADGIKSVPQRLGTTTTWEYKTIALTHGRLGVTKGKINRPVLEAELAQAGQDGWEILHLWPDTSMHGEKDGHLLLFKRQAGSQPGASRQTEMLEPTEMLGGQHDP
jgi:Domain of unknown function (DUF4177)